MAGAQLAQVLTMAMTGRPMNSSRRRLICWLRWRRLAEACPEPEIMPFYNMLRRRVVTGENPKTLGILPRRSAHEF